MKVMAKAVLALLMLGAAAALSSKISTALFHGLERSDHRFLYEYASEGRFDTNIYLSEEINERTGILDEVRRLLNADASTGLISLAEQIDRRQFELLPVFWKNGAYMEHLRRQDTSLTELFLFCKNLEELADNLDSICRYVLFLAWVTSLHFLMKCRPKFYFGMGILCIFATCLRLSNRLFAGFFVDGMGLFHLFADDMLPAMLEATLTFLIFDITFAALEKQRVSDRLSPLYADLPAISFLVAFLSRFVDCETQYCPHLDALLPHISGAVRQKPRGSKGKLFLSAVRKLNGFHTNRTLIRDLTALQSLLPPP